MKYIIGGIDMGKLIGIILVYACGISLAGILSIGLLMLLLFLKKRMQHMTEETWDLYFRNLSKRGFLLRGFVIYVIALCFIGSLSFIVFEVFNYGASNILSKIFVLVGVVYIVLKYSINKEKILNKLNRLNQV